MPSFVLTDAFININAVDLSDQADMIEITQSRELKDATTFSKTGRIRKAGLGDWQMRIRFKQNFDAAKVDATLSSIGLGVSTPIRVRAVAASAISTTNPEWQGNGMMGEYPILVGQMGEIADSQVTFLCADGIALIRDVTP